LVVRIAELTPTTAVHDPACGTGGLLIECARYLGERFPGSAPPPLSGQEKNVSTWELCKTNLLLHDAWADVRLGDTLRTPLFLNDHRLARFPRVLCSPPFGSMVWATGSPEDDPFGRFRFGAPPRSSPTFAFVQHAYATLDDDGLAVIVVPQGALFRGGAEAVIRAGLVEESIIEAVIGLPASLVGQPTAPQALLVLRRRPGHPHRAPVFLMDARGVAGKEPANVPELFAPAAEAYREHGLSPAARWVSWEEMKANRLNLNLALYLPSGGDPERPDIDALREEISALQRTRQALSAELREYLHALLPYLDPASQDR
jgi:type I restriction enzyme M protein